MGRQAAAIKQGQAGSAGETALKLDRRNLRRMILDGKAPSLRHGQVVVHQRGQVHRQRAPGVDTPVLSGGIPFSRLQNLVKLAFSQVIQRSFSTQEPAGG